MQPKDWYIGDEARKFMSVLDISMPIAHGQIEDIDKMAHIWEHAYTNELVGTEMDAHNVMMTEAVNTPKQNRMDMAEKFFEQFQVPAMYFEIQAKLSLMATGRTDGIVLDAGDGVVHTCPVITGIVKNIAIRSNHVAGRKVTEFMKALLNKDGINAEAFQTAQDAW